MLSLIVDVRVYPPCELELKQGARDVHEGEIVGRRLSLGYPVRANVQSPGRGPSGALSVGRG
jgi:hypothetical protein